MKEKPFTLDVDYITRTLKVNGVNYSFDVFEAFAEPRTDVLYELKREEDTVTITAHKKIERESAALAPAQPRQRQYERR